MGSRLQTQGFDIVRGLLEAAEIQELLEHLPDLATTAGTRNLLQLPWCRLLAGDSRILDLVESAIGPRATPVRGILFDKTASTNWNLGWHQDKKIAVKRRLDAPGFFGWSEKEGVIHCQAPREVLETCVAIRIHLDDCGSENGPLRVIPASHLSGVQTRLEERLIAGSVECTVEAGDVILMKPLLWHASSKALTPRHRRVIHIEYCSMQLPNGLEWAFA